MPDSEEQLKLFRLLVEHSLGLMCVHDLEGVLLLINPAAAQALGYSPQECLGRSIRELLVPAVQPLFEAYLGRIRSNPSDSGLMRLQAKDGTERIWYYRNVRYDEPGAAPRVLGHATDLTERRRAEEALRHSEERLRFAAQAAGFGSYDLDLVSGQAYGSAELRLLLGLSPEEAFSAEALQRPDCLYRDDRARVRKALLEARDPQGSGRLELEFRVVGPGRTLRWLLMRGRTFFEGEGKARRPVRASGIVIEVTERKQLEREILEISGREQRRIGHDLHDDLCQRLGGLQLLSGVLEEELAAEGHAQAPQAGRIFSQVQAALERARRLARGLAPVELEAEGLASALQALAEGAAQLFCIQCVFRPEARVALTDAGAATQLYRIAQEAITNAVKHGRATRVVISLTGVENRFELTVRDDGLGFRPTLAAGPGMGLRIMKYRAAMIGAMLEVRSAPGAGTTVTCAFAGGALGASGG